MLLAALLLAAADASCVGTVYPPELNPWFEPGPALAVGKAMKVAAVPAGDASLEALPAGKKPGGAFLTRFTIDKAGTYGVALNQPGWIDVLPEGAAAPYQSVSHAHGPRCTSIRKIVDYQLQPGTYRLSVTGLEEPEARVMLMAR